MAQQRDILVVEDDAAIRSLIAEILSDEGYAVRAVENGADALHAVGRQRPALVITDLAMADTDGRLLVVTLTAQDATLPVVVLSESPWVLTAYKGKAQFQCLAKPFNLDDLLACVARFVPPPLRAKTVAA